MSSYTFRYPWVAMPVLYFKIILGLIAHGLIFLYVTSSGHGFLSDCTFFFFLNSMSLVHMLTFEHCYSDLKRSQLHAICVPFYQTALMLHTEHLQSFVEVKNHLEFCPLLAKAIILILLSVGRGDNLVQTQV